MPKKPEPVRIIAVALGSREEAARAVRETVTLQLEQEAAVVVRDAAVQKIAEEHNAAIDALGVRIEAKLAQLQQWAEAHPEEFKGEERSTKFDGHQVGWRLGNPATKTLKGWTWAKVIEALEKTRKRIREKYLRVKKEANKEAMIADRRRKKLLANFGVEIVQAENFYVDPNREGQADAVLKGGKREVAAA